MARRRDAVVFGKVVVERLEIGLGASGQQDLPAAGA
jgi:hypothetical protein